MEKQVIDAGSTLIETGVIGAVAFLLLGGCAWLVRYTFQQAAKREEALRQAIGSLGPALEKQNESLERQAQVLRDIHNEIMRLQRPSVPATG